MNNPGPEVGARFGPYLLTRVLGSGGMGTVYVAQDTVMDRVVALKLISGTYAQDPNYRQRLQREARIAGRLQEPHVVPIHSAGEIDGQLYVDMRLINGTAFDAWLKQSGPLPPATAVSIVRQVASALDAAHAAGVLHRDVKPANIMITADDFAYLVDFGIANAATEQQLTQLGQLLGTWTYMAPERFSGDASRVGPSADTYALACVLFEAITGTPPFVGDRAGLIAAHLSAPVPRASLRVGVPPELDDVVARGMSKRPDERYATSGEFARAADTAVARMGATTASFTLPRFPVRPTRADTAQLRTPSTRPAPANAAQPPMSPFQHVPRFDPVSQPHTPPLVPAAPTRRKRSRWISIATALVLVVTVAAGLIIWKLSSGSPRNGVDLSKLDVGRYETKPRSVSGSATKEEGLYLAAFRLAEGIANPADVDKVFGYLYGTPTQDPKVAATLITETGTPLVQPVLEKYGMITGYKFTGYSKSSTAMTRERSGEALSITLLSFPNDDAAARAATEMDAIDFAFNNENQSAMVPGYPQAKAHYRPKYKGVRSTLASRRLVASINATTSTVKIDDLLQRIKRILDLQLPLMAKLVPVSESGLTALQRDPDTMLSRLLLVGDQPKISSTFWSLGPRAVNVCAVSAVKAELYTKAGIDRCAYSKDSRLLRTRDETAATALVQKLVDAARSGIDHDVETSDGLPNARCFEQKQAVWEDDANRRFVCVLSYRRYVASIWSNEEQDARQRAAAQYAILFNSG